MRRREFITLVGGATAGLPCMARAQQQAMRRIGILMPYAESEKEAQDRVATFREHLGKLGWIEGHNIQIDTRWATSDAGRVEHLAQELIALKPDLMLSANTLTTEVLLKLTHAIPIVFATVVDPIGSGFVASLPRPGGNATGFTNLEGSIAGKWLELLKEMAPNVNRVAFLFNPAAAPYAEIYLTPFRAAAASLAVEAIAAPVGDTPELEVAVAALARAPDGGLIVMPGFIIAGRTDVMALAASHGLPAIYPFRYYTELGGLLSYGNDQADNYGRAAAYADRILKGEKPGQLPVQAPVKFELTINLKTAKALGLEVPLRLQQQADAVIE